MKKTLLLLLALPFIALSQPQPQNIKFEQTEYTSDFQEAYQQFPLIPKGVLEAVAYGNTHIFHIVHNAGEEENCVGLPLSYGVMGLTLDGKNYFNNNLVYVSGLSGISINEIINSPEKNILAYASAFNSLMNSFANQQPSAGEKNGNIIIAKTMTALSELPRRDEGQTFALNTQLYSYFTFLNSPEFQEKYNFPDHHFNLQTLFGADNYKVLSSSKITMSNEKISDGQGDIYKSLGNNNGPTVQTTDYPAAIWNAAASCNYSSRTQAISAIVIHDIEGTYASCISWFKNCSASVSAHYVVRSSDGQITQMVLESKKAWHVGTENGYTIGIEHEGYQAQTGWYTAAMYQSSADLVKDICASGYGINKATCWSGVSCSGTCLLSSAYKIKGHQHYPNQTHNDPGPNWNWGTYYNLINNTGTSCGSPTGLIANLITSAGATLNWGSVSGSASYNVQYKQSGSSTWTTVTSATTSKSITGLSASTSYDFKVQAVCSNIGSYSSISTFTTTSSSGSNDDCASAIEIFPNASCVSTSGSVAGATAGGLAKASCDGFSGSAALKDVWYKFVATSATASIKVSPSTSFDAVLALYTSCTGGQIGCSDNGGGPGAAENINISSLIAGNTYYIRVYSYGANVPATSTFNICVVSASSPSCGTPSGLSVTSITTSGATLSWTAVAGATSYNIQYKDAGSSLWTTVTSSTITRAITGLSASTAYQFRVQAVCSNTGSYSIAATFTTSTSSSGSNDDCSNAIELFPNTTCMPTTGSVAGATPGGLTKAGCDGYSGTPALKDVWFKFVATNSIASVKVAPSASFDAVLALYTSCNGGQVGCSDNGGGPGAGETINATTLTVGNTYYIRIYSYGSSAPATSTFTVCVTSASSSSCGTPSGLSASAVTVNSAVLNWAAVSGATSYNVQYKESSSGSWVTLSSTATSQSIAGLNASTTYLFQVQAVCTSQGNYSSAATFTTSTISSGSNDDCANAIVLTPDSTCVPTNGNLAGATAGGLTKASCDGYSGTAALKDVWYKFQATSAISTITVSPSSGLDAVIAIYSSCSGGQIGCSDNGGGAGAAEAITTSALTVGTTYYIRVYSYGSNAPSTNSFNICITTPSSGSGVNCDLTLRTTIQGFKVYTHNPSGAIMFRAKMAIDADGSPRAYGPSNSGLDYTANAGSPGNWWGVVTDNNNNPVIQNSSAPYPGMYVSTTSLTDASFGATNPLRYVNSETVPFIVLPSAVTSIGGISLGDIVYVHNSTNNSGYYAVYADGGPSGKLGEGSIYLASLLGVNSNARTGGTSSAIIDYVVFPQSGSGQGTIPSISQINSIGASQINNVGGTGIVNCIASTLQMLNQTGVDEQFSEINGLSFEIYPNPLDGEILYGKFANTENQKMTVKIFDMLGRELFSNDVMVDNGQFSLTLDKENFKTGVYMIVGTSGTNRFTKRLVVK